MSTESAEVDPAAAAPANPDSPADDRTVIVHGTGDGLPVDPPTELIEDPAFNGDPRLGPLPDPPHTPDAPDTPGGGAEAEPPTGNNPGGLLGRGRYRLLDEVGRDERCGASFWRGRDSVLERDVALTVFTADSDDAARLGVIRGAMQRALRSARLENTGAARVLDVLEPEPGHGPTVAAVVAEWTPGRDLVELAADWLPPPAVAASMLSTLAEAVDDAHRVGLVLGCDHPQRIRITPEGHARLAFHAPPVETGTRDDVRGLGAALYLLLTGYWPLPDGPPGLPSAPRGKNNTLLSPRALRPDVPLELSTLALRSLAGAGSAGVHTGAAVARVLERNTSELDFAADEDEDPDTGGWRSPELDPEEPRRRRLKLSIGVAVLVAGSLAILGWVGFQVANVFGEDDTSGPALVIGTTTPGAPAPPATPPPVDGAPVDVSALRVYDISGEGSPDNPSQVRLAIDGNPETAWSTDAYKQPFPAFKPGLGLMLTLPEAVRPASVTIVSPSPGTVLEVRAASAPNTPLAQTRVIGSATLQGAETVIPLQAGPPTRYLLVWITTLAGSENQSELGEITVRKAQ